MSDISTCYIIDMMTFHFHFTKMQRLRVACVDMNDSDETRRLKEYIISKHSSQWTTVLDVFFFTAAVGFLFDWFTPRQHQIALGVFGMKTFLELYRVKQVKEVIGHGFQLGFSFDRIHEIVLFIARKYQELSPVKTKLKRITKRILFYVQCVLGLLIAYYWNLGVVYSIRRFDHLRKSLVFTQGSTFLFRWLFLRTLDD